MALEHPAILTRLESMFAERPDDGARPDTVAHAEQILRIERRKVGAN